MALVSSSSLATTRQRDVLRDAVSDFQGVLNDEERRELMGMKAIPDADSIMVFTAELDSTHRTRTGPSFASRLHTVLSSVGVFCSIVDTFVSSHPEIAALLWGSLKLTMVVAANVVSYYQVTSDLFMKLGKLCPLFADYQSLYPDSIRLQSALVEFHASLIRCCAHVVRIVQMPLHRQLLKSLLVSFEREFKPDLNDIQRHSDNVRQEIAFAKDQASRQEQHLQLLERQQAARSRHFLSRFANRTENALHKFHAMQLQRDQRIARERRQQLLDSLSTRDYLRLFKQSCKKRWENTASWIFEKPEFCDWLEGKKPVLWCSGKIGSGKTITTASVIQHVLRCKSLSSGPVSYCFV